MDKNGIYDGEVSGLGTEAEGIINKDGVTAFVPFCLDGERVHFKVLKAKGSIAYGKVEEILKPSADRVQPPCPVFYK